MTSSPFDFRTPQAGEMDRPVAEWITAAGRLASRAWQIHWNFSAELRLASIESKTPAVVLKGLSDSAFGFTIRRDEHSPPAFLTIDRPLLLALLAAVMGTPPNELPADRELSAAEKALTDVVVQQFLEPFEASWPQSDSPKLTASAPGLPRTTCRLPLQGPTLAISLLLHGPFGSRPIQLLLPRKGWFDDEDGEVQKPSCFDRTEIEAALREMPLDFVVDLGQVELTLQQLMHLKVGDLLILNQRMSEPLRANIAGKDRFDVWPGALGRNQAVRIHAPRRPATT